MTRAAFTVLHPSSVGNALGMMRDIEDARLVAGGTALQLEWAKGAAKPVRLIDLGGIGEMTGISLDDKIIRIGALTPLSALLRDPLVAERLAMLAVSAASVAGPAVRNIGTIGGNIAGRSGCLLPALLALDACLEIARTGGTGRESLRHWLSQPATPHEVIKAVILPKTFPVFRWTTRKIGLRAAFTPSVIGISGLIGLTDGRIETVRLAVGGGIVAATRLVATEASLGGLAWADVDWDALHARLIDEISAPDDMFRSGRYRRHVAANALVHGLAGLPELPARSRRCRLEAPPLAAEIRLSRRDQRQRWHTRPDVEAKIAGQLAYLTDRRMSGMLVGRILRAGVGHARIVSIDTRDAQALPGVAAVVTHRDINGVNAFGIVVQDQPALCFDKVRYKGDAVAAVAAVDERTAQAALDLIKVEYAALPLVTDPLQALADDAAAVHEGGNLQRSLHFSRGNVVQGFATAAHIVERVYTTPRQMHGFMETEGGYAQVEAGGVLSIFAGGQHGARDRQQLARILGRPEETIRVVTSPTGGAFGGKDELTVQPALALLAEKTGKPVRIQLSRAESVVAGIKRNPMTIRMRTACDADGRLLAQEVDVLSDAGAYASLGPGVLETALEHVAGPYILENVETRGRLAYTNNGVCGAFRGFGANQMTYAIECQMDLLADLCGLTPVEIRRRNLRQPGAPGYLGQIVSTSERLSEMLDAAAASSLWQEADGTGPEEIVGVGMALNYQGNGLGSLVPDPAGGRLALSKDGFIEAAYGLDEMGQGLLTSIKAAVADRLGCGRDDVLPVTGDTHLAPDSGSTTASRGGYVVWQVAKSAGALLAPQLLEAAGLKIGRPAMSLRLAPGGFADAGSNSGDLLLTYRELARSLGPDALPSATVAFDFPKTDYEAGNARYIFAFGACLVRVAVNRVTGSVRVMDIRQHTAAGPVIDVAAYLGQMEGGAIQGLGFTLTEDAMMHDATNMNGNFDSYMMPGIRDSASAMSVYALEDLDAGDELGPRGAGELGIGAIAPAIANAVAGAIGHRPLSLPLSPEAILDAMAGRA
ncbi:molybdopterin cofactor-binding domain-containing protein [Rhizobium rhododendri]|uniref:Molybdopterin-dependent oxidoreductase n=1 Tax=Rhizobium rhododendri TaxID=2506430 RepID=A0ABY8INT8_9HYPH|nr:molybdopterin cofactor-binding domain-containing protein [Rhizobium rhododendri]WFS25396.1 molybdopterin-dependent oxidoreductase [Rhizobium rhododendri]